MTAVPVITLDAPPGPGEFLAGLPGWLSESLGGYLPHRRWYGDKARSIRGINVVDVVSLEVWDHPAAFGIVDVQFERGDPSRYLVPATLTDSPDIERFHPMCALESGAWRGHLIDGLFDARVRTAMARMLTGSHSVRETHGRLDVDVPRPELLTSTTDAPSRVLGAEQSNTSVVYGSDVLIKVFRRLQPGIQPDVELTRFLTLKTDFANVPRYLGSIAYTPSGEPPCVIAVAQQFVDSTGDGWSFVLESLRARVEDGDAERLVAEAAAIAERLGVVTARMHVALASDPWSTDVAPEQIKRDDAEVWSAEYLELLDRIAAALLTHTDELARTFLDVVPGLRKHAAGFDRLIGRAKTRVHGDYHLGQTLHTPDGDFVVIDFEGEPQRTIEERRRKTSPLKDVSGMLRSFSYARGTASAWLSDASRLLASDLVAWERTMRRGFVDAYERTVAAGGGRFLPITHADVQAALAAWELDKAAYEVLYELNNRPTWLWIPLSAMVKLGEPGSPG